MAGRKKSVSVQEELLLCPSAKPGDWFPGIPVSAVAGIDEAGRGCLAGPVVAAAVILPDFKIRITVISGISLYLAADLKKTADRKQFIDTDDRTDLQTLDGAADVADAAERYRTFLINTGKGIACLLLESLNLVQIRGWLQIAAHLFCECRTGKFCEFVNDFIIF